MPVNFHSARVSPIVELIHFEVCVIASGECPDPTVPHFAHQFAILEFLIFSQQIILIFPFPLSCHIIGNFEAHQQLHSFEMPIFYRIIWCYKLLVQFRPFCGLPSGIDHRVPVVDQLLTKITHSIPNQLLQLLLFWIVIIKDIVRYFVYENMTHHFVRTCITFIDNIASVVLRTIYFKDWF